MLIDQLQELVALAGLLTRNASFAWDSLEDDTMAAATAFSTPRDDHEETGAAAASKGPF